jgi:hypothetical protein
MTSQQLYEILKKIDSLDQSLGIQKSLESVRDSLVNLVSAPAQPQHQGTLATALSSLTDAATKLETAISPSEAAALKEMDGGEFFDPGIAAKVTNSVQTNAMTPAVARDFVNDLATRRSTYLATVRSTLQGLEKLKITSARPKPGAANVAFLIPREIFDNELGQFAKELRFINLLVGHFAEAQTAETEVVILEQLSSSMPTVVVMGNLLALSLLGTVINKFLDVWERILRIRKIRAELDDVGVRTSALEELDERITSAIEEVVEESTELVIGNYPGEAVRKSELANAIRGDTKRLFAQIERGLTVEFRAEPEAGDAKDQESLQRIADVSKTLKFPMVENEPLLLGKGEILGDGPEAGYTKVVKHTKKTTTQKTTSTKQRSDDGSKQE